MRKNVVCLMMILFMASSLPINASAGPTDDIPTNAQNTGVHDTLVDLLVKADLVTTLSGTGPFTVFAPTDTAFANAGIDPANFNTQEEIDSLSEILLYHVISGDVPSSAVTDCMLANSVNGNPLAFTVDGGVMVNDANVTVADVTSSNGVIHVIDKVLIPTETPNDIPRTAQCTGSHNTLVTAVIQAGLLETLQGEGPFTVFAPTDQAFTDAGIDLSTVSQSDLADILTYHVVSGAVPASAVTECMSADSVNGNPLSFTVNGGVMVNDANVTIADVNTSNGVIHVIDKVLIPTATPNDIPRTAQCTGSHNTLVTAVIQAGLLETLQGEGPFTVFAPTDQAFTDAGIDLSTVCQPDLFDILTYHVVTGAVPSSAVTEGMSAESVNGNTLSFTVNGGVMVNDANVIIADVSSSNGIIHVIDKVLFPTPNPADITRTAQCTGVHNTLVDAVIQGGLLETLQGEGPFTVFAPTDQAFSDAQINLSNLSQSDIQELLKYHVLDGNVPSSAVTDCMSEDTLNGNPLSFTVSSTGSVMVNEANVTLPDQSTSNGVIHVIDKVLTPTATPKDIPRTAACTGSHNTLVSAVIDAGLLDALSGNEPLTVFAPTDAAFAALDIDLSTLSETELADVLKYHVVAGAVPSSAVTDCMPADTLNGNPLSFTVNSTGAVMVNDANVTSANVNTSNGIIHVIDKVLMPTATPKDIPRTAQCTGSHNTLVDAVIQGGLLDALSGDEQLTVFAPTDAAFSALGIDLSTLNQTELADILKYHVVAGEVPSSAVTDCMPADTLNGNPLSFTVNNTGAVKVNDANVITPNVNTSNGIIHVIDKVLMPTATPKDIPRTAQCTGSHNTLVDAVIQAGLLETLQDEGPYTVFAPTDQAFTDAGIDLSTLNQSQLSDILLYHVLGSSVQSSAITDGLEITMVNGDNATFSTTSGVMINGANVTQANVATSNGIIHVIDKVLMPPVESPDDSEGSTDDSESSADDDSSNLLWIIIGVILVLGGGAGAVLFVRNRNSAASASKDFSSQGLMNQLESVDQTAYIGQSSQPMFQQQTTAQVPQHPTLTQTVEVIPQPVAAEPVVLQQWTDESGYTWRKMDDGSTMWWTGTEWQKYG